MAAVQFWEVDMSLHAAHGANNLLITTAPAADADNAAAIARDHFGIEAEVSLLTSERDKNFHLVAADGQEYVLKITNSAEDPVVTNFQTEALLHIEARDAGLPVPRVCRTVDGRTELALPLGGETHTVRLLTYLTGEPQYRAPPSAPQREDLGRCLARLGLALRDFRHPGATHDLLWDISNVGRLRDWLPNIGDTELRELATGFLDRFEDEVRPVQQRQRRQVVHNDFNPHNVLVDPANPVRVTGVLDFGDMVETPLVNDVAIAASYQVAGAHSLVRAADFVAAYHSVLALHAEEIDILFDLIAMRHVTTITITEWRARLYPENRAYIMRNHPRAAEGLRAFAAIDRDAARRVFRQACGME
ncbi:phosphotransferase [Starkeya sp. ORNL1]|uniref:phosphotransferase n=1 Tax=Starkeya sp. ORNL1 TaxID=2709380 RepID=UPI00197F1F07|nr:phosphotransferase [Starkeya sp. ORNL1]